MRWGIQNKTVWNQFEIKLDSIGQPCRRNFRCSHITHQHTHWNKRRRKKDDEKKKGIKTKWSSREGEVGKWLTIWHARILFGGDGGWEWGSSADRKFNRGPKLRAGRLLRLSQWFSHTPEQLSIIHRLQIKHRPEPISSSEMIKSLPRLFFFVVGSQKIIIIKKRRRKGGEKSFGDAFATNWKQIKSGSWARCP